MVEPKNKMLFENIKSSIIFFILFTKNRVVCIICVVIYLFYSLYFVNNDVLLCEDHSVNVNNVNNNSYLLKEFND